jgi:hypothetical protein
MAIHVVRGNTQSYSLAKNKTEALCYHLWAIHMYTTATCVAYAVGKSAERLPAYLPPPLKAYQTVGPAYVKLIERKEGKTGWICSTHMSDLKFKIWAGGGGGKVGFKLY